MITKEELKTIDNLRETRENLQGLLDSFESRHVKTGIGLVSFYDDMMSSPKTNKDYAQVFHNYFKELRVELTNKAIEEIKLRIKHIDVDLGKYIKEDMIS